VVIRYGLDAFHAFVVLNAVPTPPFE